MAAFFEGDPMSLKGGAGWLALGALAAMLALLVAMFAPSIIPARASQSNL